MPRRVSSVIMHKRLTATKQIRLLCMMDGGDYVHVTWNRHPDPTKEELVKLSEWDSYYAARIADGFVTQT